MRPPALKGVCPGFSLIELLVVIAIIAILAALATPSYNSIMERMTISKVQNDHMRGLTAAMGLYRADHMNKWPIQHPRSTKEMLTWCGPGKDENASIGKSKEVMVALRPYYGNDHIKEDGAFEDPWGTQYAVKWDINSGTPNTPPNSKVEYGTGEQTNQNVPRDFIVVSMGKNREQATVEDLKSKTSDDVFSFCAYGDTSLFK